MGEGSRPGQGGSLARAWPQLETGFSLIPWELWAPITAQTWSHFEV